MSQIVHMEQSMDTSRVREECEKTSDDSEQSTSESSTPSIVRANLERVWALQEYQEKIDDMETTNEAARSALQIAQVPQECEKTTDNASTSESTNGGYETPTPSIVRAEVWTLQEYQKIESDKTTNEATQHIAQNLPGCEKTTNGNAKT